MLLVGHLVVEQEHHRVAAELHERAAPAVRLRQQRREAGVDHVDELLGSLAAVAGEPLGQTREARHVGEHQRAVDGLGQHFDRTRQPCQHRPGHEGSERSGFGLHLQS